MGNTVNLTKLFEMQKELDERINREHPPKQGEDRLAKKILALQVELGECANEWRGFKFWSKDRESRTKTSIICPQCHGEGEEQLPYEPRAYPCENCNCRGHVGYRNAMLEEFVDCLHFILSIGLEACHYDSIPALERNIYGYRCENLIKQFNEIMYVSGKYSFSLTNDNYLRIVMIFVGLGEMLGFTWEQIEAAYIAKNITNYERQANGY